MRVIDEYPRHLEVGTHQVQTIHELCDFRAKNGHLNF
jgi:hypothetical protein